MSEEQKDFKAVKVQMKSSQKQGETLSRSMLYSGINIFGQLSQIYMQNKDQFYTQSAPTNFASTLETSASNSGEGSMMQLSQDVLGIFKRLQKKDSITKVKAFQELDKYIEQMDGENDEMQNLLTFFLYHFCRIIMNEPDKKVREAAHSTFSHFIKKSRRKLGPHLKKIFSLWYCSFFDISNDVAQLAKKNFEAAFPEDKRDQVFKMAYKNFLHFANEQLKQSEDQISESAGDLTKAQREDVFDRVTSCVLLALANSFNFISEWTDEEKEHYKKKLIDILDLGKIQPVIAEKQQIDTSEVKGAKGQKVSKQAKQQQSYLWGFLQASYRGRVRSSCLVFISNLMQNLPQDIVESHIASIAPLVFGLIGEDNSLLQTTLWREALFSIGKSFPHAWEFVNIKKNFQPKLYITLKNAGFGAPLALYENFVKFVSIFPFYHLVNYTEDKQNKASFKERCNLIRETLTNLYSGLKNDESVAFHKELVGSYYESLTFLILKRLQPLLKEKTTSQEDAQFAMTQFKKSIQAPLEDFLANYEKLMSKHQNQRNIRVTIPSMISSMLVNLSDREVDAELFTNVCEYIAETLVDQIDTQNSIRVVTAILKKVGSAPNKYFSEIVLTKIVNHYYKALDTKINEELQDLGRKNIETFNKKCQNMMTLIYRINKYNVSVEGNLISIDKLRSQYDQVSRKEEMAKNALSQEDLSRFKLIKLNILKALILSINLKQEGNISDFINSILISSTDFDTKQKVLLPNQEFKKISFDYYYQKLNQECHDKVISFIRDSIIQNPESITSYWELINSGLQLLSQQKPSYLIKDDQSTIAKSVSEKVKDVKSGPALSAYFNSIKILILDSEQTEYDSIRQQLFDKLLTLRTQSVQYQQLWTIFEQTIRSYSNKQNKTFFDYCLNKLKEQLKTIIHSNSNYDIDTFNRFTQIVKSFVQLCSNKQQIIEDILLQEDNFSNLENNSLPLKMFRDLTLSGGVGFDVTQLFTKDRGDQYVWLVAALLNTKYLASLSNFIQLQKQLVIFVETEIIPALVNQAQSGNSQFVLDIVQYIADKAQTNNGYLYTLEYLIKKMIDPGEEFSSDEKPVLKVDDFKKIFETTQGETVNAILTNKDHSNQGQVQVFLKVLRQIAYYINDEPQVNQIFQTSEKYLKGQCNSQKKPDQQLYIHLEVYMALMNYAGDQSSHKEMNVQILTYLLSNISTIAEDSLLLNATLEYVASIMGKLGMSEFKKGLQSIDFQNFLSQVVTASQEKNLQPLTFIHLLSLIRKTIGSDLITDKQQLIDQTINIAKEHAIGFDLKIQKIQQSLQKELQEQDDGQQTQEKQHKEERKSMENNDDLSEEGDQDIEEFEFEMLQDLAETLLVFPSYINPSLNENDLFILIGSGVESLQKAAFVLLKFLYENYIPEIKYKIDETEELKQLQIEQEQTEKKEQDEETKFQENAQKEKYKNKVAFRNISEILIELLENPPSFSGDHEQQLLLPSSQVDQLIYGEKGEGCMNQKVFGYFLAWNALLAKIDNGRIKCQLQSDTEYQTVLGALNEYLEENYEIYQMLLVSLTAYLPHYKKGLSEAFNVNNFEPEYMNLGEVKQNTLFSVYTLINFMKSFPSLARKYYQECEKQILDIVMPYIRQVVSPAILENEIKKIEVAQIGLGSNELSFQLFKSTKEILATYQKGEIQMQLKIRIPTEYPLKSVEVEVNKQLKISEKQLRKWILSIRKILQIQNGDIITAVLLWKSNIDKEVEGVEDCYICYSVVHDTDQSLPKMPCKTCKNKFHVACIRKWFRTSHKSNCPLCQSYFF